MRLSPHFSLNEFTFSQTAVREGIHNLPNDEGIANLKKTAAGMEKVRELLGGNPIYISSGFRAPLLNSVVKGSISSNHVKGLACDFVCNGYGDVFEVATAIADSAIDFETLIYEGRWVHIDFPAEGEGKRKVLTAHFKHGTVTYTEGVGY